MSGIDLHAHSTASDGTMTPAQLVRHAQRLGLQALGLTDHDTVNGLAEARATGSETGVEIISGCELSVDNDTGFMHILGLFLPRQPEKLMRGMEELRELRKSRNHRIVAKLQELGLDVTYEEFKAEANGGTIGRPHLAKVLLKKNYVISIQEAFDKYIGEHGRAYFPKDQFSPEKAIALLKAEGATVVLAHPYTLKLDPDAELARLDELKEMGLDGIEAHYTEHSQRMTRHYLDMAKRLDLVVSGGSDFHGTVKPSIELGRGKGGLRIPYSVLETIKARRAEQGLPSEGSS